MKPIYQLTNSDCMRACVASIFELPLKRVPFFGESAIKDIKNRNAMTHKERSRAALQQADDFAAWLKAHGLDVEYISDPDWAIKRGAKAARLPWGLCIGGGRSPRGPWDHATVWDAADWTNRKMVHDPHPSGAGLKGKPHTFTCFLLVDPAKFRRALCDGKV
jgi:hypothetical protein